MKCSDENLKHFQALLKKEHIDAFAVTDIVYINRLTDFYFSGQGDALLLVTPKKAFCFTKPLYLIDLKNKTPYLSLVDSLNIADVSAKAAQLKAKNKAFDSFAIDYRNGTHLFKEGFAEKGGFLSASREVKTESEIKKISRACHISFKAYDEFKKNLKTGMTEIAAARMLEDIMKKLGGQGLAFETIVCFGETSANPHHVPCDRKLKNNEPVLIDYGCSVEGYCSDITRTFWHGAKPTARFKEIFDIVKGSHDAAVKAAKAGGSGAAVDIACKQYMDSCQSGISAFFIHGLGHGLGTQIHEAPFVSSKREAVLKTGNVFTIEPGLYFEGEFGVRYENTFWLSADGMKNLTK